MYSSENQQYVFTPSGSLLEPLTKLSKCGHKMDKSCTNLTDSGKASTSCLYPHMTLVFEILLSHVQLFVYSVIKVANLSEMF